VISVHVLLGAVLTVLVATSLAAHVFRATRSAGDRPEAGSHDCRVHRACVAAKLRAYWELGKPRLSALAVFAVVAGAYMAGRRAARIRRSTCWSSTTIGTFLAAIGRRRAEHVPRAAPRPADAAHAGPAVADRSAVAARGARVRRLGVGASACCSCCSAPRRSESTAIAARRHLQLDRRRAVCRDRRQLRAGLHADEGAHAAQHAGRRDPGRAAAGGRPRGVVGQLAMPQLVLFAILFCWQIPHFLAIAWRYREDYARAGMRMLPDARSDRASHRRSRCCSTSPGSASPACCRSSRAWPASATPPVAVLLDVLFFVPTVFAALTRRDARCA
jgi:hypothetical protein